MTYRWKRRTARDGEEALGEGRGYHTGLNNGNPEYVFEAFDVASFHYLLKPVEEDKFREVFRRAERELDKRRKQQQETVFIKTRSRSFTLDSF
ncbi:MAG: hypothetical protein NC313_10990 [Butyrivibrio sp.]|nr:hypothetical protein [Butyrivibrio sp.]